MTSVINYNVKEVFSKLSCFFLGGGLLGKGMLELIRLNYLCEPRSRGFYF